MSEIHFYVDFAKIVRKTDTHFFRLPDNDKQSLFICEYYSLPSMNLYWRNPFDLLSVRHGPNIEQVRFNKWDGVKCWKTLKFTVNNVKFILKSIYMQVLVASRQKNDLATILG